MSLFKSLAFRFRSRGYNPAPQPEPHPEPEPIALKINRKLKDRDVVDLRLEDISQQINYHEREIRRLQDCQVVRLAQREAITNEMTDVYRWSDKE